MPIDSKIEEQIIDKIKNEDNPVLKTQLIGLYDVLLRIYENDDKYDQVSRQGNYQYNQQIKNLFNKALNVIQGN